MNESLSDSREGSRPNTPAYNTEIAELRAKLLKYEDEMLVIFFVSFMTYQISFKFLLLIFNFRVFLGFRGFCLIDTNIMQFIHFLPFTASCMARYSLLKTTRYFQYLKMSPANFGDYRKV